MTVTKEIRVELSSEDKQRLATEMAEHVRRCESIEDEKRIKTADLSNAIKAERKAYRAKAKTYRDGHEYRGIECEEVHDFDRNIVTTKRVDNGEVVGERAMRVDERQQAIEFPDGQGENDSEPGDVDAAPVIALPEKPKKARGKAATSTEAH